MQGEKIMKNGIWDNKELKDLFTSIEKIKKEGQPLRKAFMEHARKYSRQPNSVRNYYYHEIDNLEQDNDRINQMLRFQNKYRNYKAKEKPIKKDNIIKFSKKKEKISEAELQALFMGLVRLVKRSATEEINEQVKSTMERASQELRKTIVALNNKEREYRELKDAFIKIKEENSKLVKDMFKLKCDKAGKLHQKFEQIDLGRTN